MMAGETKILVRGVNWVGDAVLTLPALAALHRAMPRARIHVLTWPQVADVYRAAPGVSEVILYEKQGRHRFLPGMWRLGRELRAYNFDLAVLLQNAFEAALIAKLSGAKTRAGYGTDGRGFLLNRSIKLTPEIKSKHQVNYYLGIIAGLGLDANFSEPALRLPSGEYQTARARLDRELWGDGPLVGIAPGAAYGPAKCWFPDRFAAVAERFVGQKSARVVLFGGPGEAGVAAQVGALAGVGVLDLAGRTSLTEAMALIGLMDLFLTNDSGLMHVAAAQGVPVVALFGSTNPVTTSPRGEQSVIIRHAVDCSPCLEPECPLNYECMAAIGVDEVFEVCAQKLGVIS